MIDLVERIDAHALKFGFVILAGFVVFFAAILLGNGTVFSVVLGLSAGLAAPAGGILYTCTQME